MVKLLFLIGLLVSVLAGCSINTSQVPIAETYPISEQKRMQAVHHWDVLAEHEASLMSSSLVEFTAPVYISEAQSETSFDRGFKNLLTSQLVGKGAVVKASASDAVVVSYDVEVVEHRDRGYTRAPEGAWTLLASGVALLVSAADNWTPSSKVIAPAVIGADLFSGNLVDKSRYEIIITIQAVNNDQIIHSSSNIYYINGGDSRHYSPSRKTIRVSG